MIIAFSRTTAALVAGRKTVTRRQWSEGHARKFHVGQIVDAWSASPRVHGHPAGKVRILSVTKEPTCEIPDSDWEAEGFAYMEENGIDLGKGMQCKQLWELWRSDPELELYAGRFELVSLLPGIVPERYFRRCS